MSQDQDREQTGQRRGTQPPEGEGFNPEESTIAQPMDFDFDTIAFPEPLEGQHFDDDPDPPASPAPKRQPAEADTPGNAAAEPSKEGEQDSIAPDVAELPPSPTLVARFKGLLRRVDPRRLPRWVWFAAVAVLGITLGAGASFMAYKSHVARNAAEQARLREELEAAEEARRSQAEALEAVTQERRELENTTRELEARQRELEERLRPAPTPTPRDPEEFKTDALTESKCNVSGANFGQQLRDCIEEYNEATRQ